MASISPCCVEDFSGTVEYFSSTGRVRNTHPAVGKTTSDNAIRRTNTPRRMKRDGPIPVFEYSAHERLQKVRVTSWQWLFRSCHSERSQTRKARRDRGGTCFFRGNHNCRNALIKD